MEDASSKFTQRGARNFWEMKMDNFWNLRLAPEATHDSLFGLIHLAVRDMKSVVWQFYMSCSVLSGTESAARGAK